MPLDLDRLEAAARTHPTHGTCEAGCCEALLALIAELRPLRDAEMAFARDVEAITAALKGPHAD